MQSHKLEHGKLSKIKKNGGWRWHRTQSGLKTHCGIDLWSEKRHKLSLGTRRAAACGCHRGRRRLTDKVSPYIIRASHFVPLLAAPAKRRCLWSGLRDKWLSGSAFLLVACCRLRLSLLLLSLCLGRRSRVTDSRSVCYSDERGVMLCLLFTCLCLYVHEQDNNSKCC